jgi:hypothetical protein
VVRGVSQVNAQAGRVWRPIPASCLARNWRARDLDDDSITEQNTMLFALRNAANGLVPAPSSPTKLITLSPVGVERDRHLPGVALTAPG